MMNQSTPENGYRLQKSEKLFIRLFVMLLRSIAWTSRTELENEGIIDEARRLHGGFILSTWHRDIFLSIWMFRELNLTAMISASRDGEGIFQVMRHFNFQGIRLVFFRQRTVYLAYRTFFETIISLFINPIFLFGFRFS